LFHELALIEKYGKAEGLAETKLIELSSLIAPRNATRAY
jgi:hypothetical protein